MRRDIKTTVHILFGWYQILGSGASRNGRFLRQLKAHFAARRKVTNIERFVRHTKIEIDNHQGRSVVVCYNWP